MNLVTGATGFIGGHLARRLVNDRRPTRVLCRPGSRLPPELVDRVEIAPGDLRDRPSLVRAARGVERVFHCAGHVSDWGTDETFHAMNVQGTRWILEAAKAADARRVVHLSSIAAFGTPAPAYFDDASPYGCSEDRYSRTKAEGERVVREFHDRHGLEVTILRPPVVYGPGGTWLEQPLRMIERGKLFLIAGATGTCHPCFIENLIDAMLLAADHPAAVGEGFIVGDGESISFRDYFDAVAFIAGKPPVRRSIPMVAARAAALVLEASARVTRSATRPMLTRAALAMISARSEMSTTKIRRMLGFQPRYTFRAAVEELRAWYRECDR